MKLLAFPYLFSQIVLVCGCVSQFYDFSQDIRALQGARTCTGPAGEIRGGLHQQLSHSDVGPKITNKNRNFEKPLQQNF